MKDEILQKVYDTDAARIPRYRLVDKDGNIVLDGIEIQLLNQIEQVGTPYSTEAVLPDDLAAEICPDVDDPTPADALRTLNSDVVKVVVQALSTLQQDQARDNIKAAPAYTLGTEDIEAGSASTEPNGSLHFIYEPA